jgi:hypothetical protein
MKTAVKLFKVEGEYDGRPTSGFIYAANENDAEGLFVMEWTWGTHDDVPISIEAKFVTDAQAEVAVEGGAPVARFLTEREKAAWWQKLEPETYKPTRGRALA